MNLPGRQRLAISLSMVLMGCSLFIRFKLLGLSNADLIQIKGWYDHLYINGAAGLADPTFSNYPPAYLYLLWFSTLFSNWVDGYSAIKLIPTLFDLLSAVVIFRMAHLRYDTVKSYIITAGFCLLPTIMFNSTGWGQIDSMYVSFLLLCLYLLLTDKPAWALISFGMAFSFKAQSIFFLPFPGILFLKGRFKWYYFLLVPAVYVILGFPAAWLGRSWYSILTIYIGQVGQFRTLSNNAPNLYIFISNTIYDSGVRVGLGIFVLTMVIWGWINWRSNITFSQRQMSLMALTALVLVSFALPKMHERYFYPVDVFSYANLIFAPEMWFVPVFCQLVSGLSYSVFIAGASTIFVEMAALLNTVVVIYVVRKQLISLRGSE